MHKNQNYGSEWITQSDGYIKFGFNIIDIQNMGGSHYIMQDDKLFVIYTDKCNDCDCNLPNMKTMRLFRKLVNGKEGCVNFTKEFMYCAICGHDRYEGFTVDGHVYCMDCFGSACKYRNDLEPIVLDYGFDARENIMIKKVSDHLEHSCIGYLYDDTNDDLNELVSLYFIQIDTRIILDIPFRNVLNNTCIMIYHGCCGICHKCNGINIDIICLDCRRFIEKYNISRYSAIMILLREICDRWMIPDIGFSMVDVYLNVIKN
jgi:hypothetical protein